MEAMNALTDREILLRAAEDQGHLGVLVKRYRTPLYNFVYRFVGDRETAEDIVQETFLRCLRHSHQYPAIEQVSTWLYTIAGNLAKTELRRRKRWQWIPISPQRRRTARRLLRTHGQRPTPRRTGRRQPRQVPRRRCHRRPALRISRRRAPPRFERDSRTRKSPRSSTAP